MWIKLDDGFATHPKIIDAGPIPALLQVRAICYCSQHLTDGFLPANAVSLLLSGLDEWMFGVEDSDISGLPTHGMRADDIDWPPIMVKHGLWEEREHGYYVHDYLQWNISKKDYERIMKQKREAGRKGGKARVHNALRAQAGAQAGAQAKSKHSISTSISSLNSLKSLKNQKEKSVREKRVLRPIADSDHPTEKHLRFAESLGIDPGPEWGKFKNYCLAHDKRYANFEAAFRNWLANAAERPHAVRHLRE